MVQASYRYAFLLVCFRYPMTFWNAQKRKYMVTITYQMFRSSNWITDQVNHTFFFYWYWNECLCVCVDKILHLRYYKCDPLTKFSCIIVIESYTMKLISTVCCYFTTGCKFLFFIWYSHVQTTRHSWIFWGVPYCMRKRVMQVRKVDNLEKKRLLLIPMHTPAHCGLVICSGITTVYIK